MLQKVLQTASGDQTDSKVHIQELLKEDVTYEELEVLLSRNQNTKHLSENLQEKLEQSEYTIIST